jgi:hypothetical protein
MVFRGAHRTVLEWAKTGKIPAQRHWKQHGTNFKPLKIWRRGRDSNPRYRC